MIMGLVLGKFYPLHTGHLGLINFASAQCDVLYVLVCASDKENISGKTRLKWLCETYKNDDRIKPILLNYSEDELPNTSVSSMEVSKIWASKIKTILPQVEKIFTSEQYGDYLAEYLGCEHICFEPERTTTPISASDIRENVFKNWYFLADAARPFFVKKVCIYGTESTGKSTLTEKLAKHFETCFVPEMARDIIEATDECTEQHLIQIAELHAKKINANIKEANKLLFVDTDLNITSSYSKFLFGKDLKVEDWVKEANQFDLYLYLDNDVPHFQDGTRLSESRRNELDISHKKQLTDNGIEYERITGTWDERLEKSVAIIEELCKF